MSELPPPTREVARLCKLIGAEATMALVERWGGTRIYVAASVTPECELAQVVGYEAARYFAERYGRDQFMVPVARRWRIMAYKTQGMTYAQIARATGSSERTVYRILHEEELVRSQFDLFDESA